ncbi:ABC transporter substrate-binding protein [Agrobacterium vaccinii]|uniref:ABC transporter substrate-binding protein n=1 Tax=Agrobacterium vaccinii TaxID=2735528 RepID=UPI001E37F41A|nr:ABC transporter substrate-binding protein [Agrobacterium vaccinii]UHS63657.1 ABC transporter substrate-binding protein [Agrobacterium vaccinii]
MHASAKLPYSSIRRFAAALALSALVPAANVWAEDLNLAYSSSATSMDPQFHNASQNIAVSRNMFETLTQMDPDSRIIPNLAESWTKIDDLTWEFKLRPAKFQDGSDFTAEDVAWSLQRPNTIENSPSSFAIYTRAITKTEVVDPHTVRLITKTPYPLLPADLTSVFIVSKKASEGITSEKFATPEHMIGTGPYKFVKYTPDDRVVMTRFDDYWGGKPAWDNVTIRFMPNDGSRMTALLSGDVNAIENVPTPDIEKVKANPDLVYSAKKTHRLIFLFLDSGRDSSPGVKAADGSAIAKNPLTDVRVRKAINMAIDRKAISDRLMMGLAYPTNNLSTDQMLGFDPALENVPFDQAAAKKLLADAGYPDGFRLTLGTPNNRLLNDERVAQAIAQMLTRIGIRTDVDAVPFSAINTKGNKGEFSAVMMGWGVQTAEASSGIRMMVACPDKARGWGVVNWSHYCNPALTEQLVALTSEMDDAKRNDMLKAAVHTVNDDMPIVPLYFQGMTWAAKKGIKIIPRMDERTSALSFEPAQ